ncbi:aldo/keto reductase [Streptomyces sp. NPDC000594]|uniref:aldo/keto reductase n=1 Tax=Streptomyces sp. NPDC000594 TaxID=3154261 RepID=UPI0033303A09
MDLEPRHLARGLWTRPLGLHCARLGDPAPGRGGDGRALAALRRGIECGAMLVDTADHYGNGHAERLVGRLLRELQEPPHLVSKVGRLRGSAPHPYAGKRIQHQLEQTLDNLYTDRVDVYVLDSHDFGPQDRYLDIVAEQMGALRELEYIGAVGLRGPYAPYGAGPAERSAAADRFVTVFRAIRPDVVWTRCNVLLPMAEVEGEDLAAFTRRHGTGLILASPLAHGLLAGGAGGDRLLSDLPTGLRDAVGGGLAALHRRFGDAPGVLVRVALRWCLQRAPHAVTLVGFSTARQVDEVFTGLGPPLDDEELSAWEECSALLRSDGSPVLR